jgi:uncharacterized membrane protein
LSRKSERAAASLPPPAPRLWAPASALMALAAAAVALSSSRPWFPDALARVLPDLLAGLAALSALAGAAAALSGAFSSALERHLGAPARRGPGAHRGWLAAAYAASAVMFLYVKYAQFRGGQLTSDTPAVVNAAYNLMTRGALQSTVLGVSSYYAVHFMPLLALLAPLSLLWGGALPFLAAQTLALCALPALAYALAWRRSRSAAAAACAFWLAWTCPPLWTVLRANAAPQLFLPLFLLLAAWGWETGRRGLALLGAALALCCVEQAPLSFLGAGLYLALVPASDGTRRRGAGAALAAGAALLGLLEMRFIRSHADPFHAAVYGRMFADASLLGAVWPPERLLPLAKTLASTGFLPLAAPLELVPFAVAFLPHLFALPTSYYHLLVTHYPVYVLGPLLWALAAGVARAHAAFGTRALLAWTLLAGAANLAAGPGMLQEGWSPQLFWSMPVLAPRVPSGASVWAVEFASSWLAARSQLKVIMPSGAVESPAGLFLPDYVLVDPLFALSEGRPGRDRVMALLARERYVLEARTETMYLLRHPRPSPAGASPPVELPPSDAAGLAYGRSLAALVPPQR